MTDLNEKIIVGQINGVYGVKGWVKVFSHTDPRDNILNYSPWLVKFKGEWRSIQLQEAKVIQGGKSLIAQLEDITDRDVAKQYMGCEVAILPEQLPALGNEDVYWRELIGSEVYNEADDYLGKVTGLVETGAHDVLRVEDLQTQTTALIPFVLDVYILEVDIAGKKVIVDWDLADLDRMEAR